MQCHCSVRCFFFLLDFAFIHSKLFNQSFSYNLLWWAQGIFYWYVYCFLWRDIWRWKYEKLNFNKIFDYFSDMAKRREWQRQKKLKWTVNMFRILQNVPKLQSVSFYISHNFSSHICNLLNAINLCIFIFIKKKKQKEFICYLKKASTNMTTLWLLFLFNWNTTTRKSCTHIFENRIKMLSKCDVWK